MIASGAVYFRNKSKWQFHNPVELNVGRGCRQALVDRTINQRLIIVTTARGRHQFSQDGVLAKLLGQSTTIWVDSVRENPGLSDLQIYIDQLKGVSFDAIIAFGGGSAMDAAKALSVALAPECLEHSLKDLLANPALHACARAKPLYTVATTAGTGSEVTPFATIWHHEIKKKLSLSGPAVWPKAAFVDSALTDTVPISVTVSTGLDAINQAAESIWNKNANSITFGYAMRALQLGFTALPQLEKGVGGQSARDQMAEASLLAGLAISHTRTALCHSMSYPLTAHFGVPHGLACAFPLHEVLRHNLQADDGRFVELAKALTGGSDVSNLLTCFDQLHEVMQVRERVKAYIPSLAALLALEGEMFTPGRADNNLADIIVKAGDIIKAAWGQ